MIIFPSDLALISDVSHAFVDLDQPTMFESNGGLVDMLDVGDVGLVSSASVLARLEIFVRGIPFSASPPLIFLDGKLNLRGDIGSISRVKWDRTRRKQSKDQNDPNQGRDRFASVLLGYDRDLE